MGAGLIGLTIATAPSASAEALGIPYRCSLPGGATNLPLTMDVRGSAPDQVHLGDSVIVTDFQVTLHMSPQMVDALTALDAQDQILSINIDNLRGSVFVSAGETDFTVPTLPIPGIGVPPADVDAPGQPTRFGPITMTQVGIARFRVGFFDLGFAFGGDGGTTAFTSGRCTGGNITEFTTVNVLPAATGTATGTPTGTPTGGLGRPPARPSPTATATVTPVNGTTVNGAPVSAGTQAGGTLANTGAAHTGVITGAGGALVLLGAGLTFLARRRRLLPGAEPVGPGAGD